MPAAAFRPVEGAEPIPGYRLEALLGRGGFGEVWRASSPGGFHVALKFLAADEAGAERELRALRTLQRLRDGHLLHLFGVWRVAGSFVLAMELADGTLLDRLEECRARGLPGVPRDELLRCFEQAARGLDYLNEPKHALEDGGKPVAVQHGDVKPQNLLLVGTACKLGDFGLMRCLGDSASQKSSSMTAAYAPPEVFDGKPSRSSDQYSLAVSWCLLRGGRLPFEGSPLQLLYAHARTPPDLSMLPEAERPAVERALSKAPKDRWPNCTAFLEALRGSPAGAVPHATAPREESPHTLPDRSTPTNPSGPVPKLRTGAAPPAVRRGWVLAGLALVGLLTGAVGLGVLWSALAKSVRPTQPEQRTDNNPTGSGGAKRQTGGDPNGTDTRQELRWTPSHLAYAQATASLMVPPYLLPVLWLVPPPEVPEESGWAGDYAAAYARARQEKKLILVAFTGRYCVVCRADERNVFTRPEVRAETARFVRVRLYTDIVPD